MPGNTRQFASDSSDVLLIGGGIMSATLGAMLKRLDPDIGIQMVEVCPELGSEASDVSNNAGTGHAGVCEISYTPDRGSDGHVPIDRALRIFEQFEHSKQFWGYAVAGGMVGASRDFIKPSPHICFMEGAEEVDFLQARHNAMKQHHFFRNMQFSADPKAINAWAPLVMEGRGPTPVAATTGDGTEVNFGLLARRFGEWLGQQDQCGVATGWKVTRLERGPGEWCASMLHEASGETRLHRAKFIYVGAGGGSLFLLQSTGLPEVSGLAGFPIGGQWLICDNPSLAARHSAKVYGIPPAAMPSLGAPHLDVRVLTDKRQLLFGPFGTWTTRFLLHSGSLMDLPLSVRPGNLPALVRSGLKNLNLVHYLVEQSLQGMGNRLKALRCYYPAARAEDWQLVDAGIRVQTIKKSDRGAIYFGTEVFSSADRSIAALLGASPGASVAVNIALETVKTCFPHLLSGASGQARMKEMIPTFDVDIKQSGNAPLFERISRETNDRLGISNQSPCGLN